VGSMLSMTGREVQAAEWSAEPSLAVKGEYNSNLTLSRIPGEVWGYWVSPSVRFAGSTERLEVSGKAAGDFVTYYGDQNRSLTNGFFPVVARYSTERDVFTLDGSFVRDNTLRTELQQTGAVLGFTQRNLISMSPSWTRSVTENLSLQLGYQYTNATYENGRSLGLFDYDVNGGNLGVSYKLNEGNDIQLTGSYTKLETDSGLKSGNAGGSLSVTHVFSEATTVTAFGGPRFLDQTQTVGNSSLSSNQLVWTFGGSIRTKWEDARASLDGGQEVNVSGLGVLLKTNRLGATVSKDLTEELTVSLAGQAFQVQALPVQGSSAQAAETRLMNVTPAVTWKLNQWWALEASYSYFDRKVDVTNDSFHGNSTFLKLTYNMPKLSISR
jgi:Putative beta-barrel porin 2